MVGTRNHPRGDFPATPEPSTTTKSSSLSPFRSTSPTPASSTAVTRRARSTHAWSHTPSNLTLLWLGISLPTVIWDTGYIMLRPHTMPGGFLHKPIWGPYALYGTIDYVYGLPAYEARDGFPSAQGALNIVETVMYFVYLYICLSYGVEVRTTGRGAPKPSQVPGSLWGLLRARAVTGRPAAWAALIGFSAAVMTVSKTVLYWLNEYFSGFKQIGHNDPATLFFMWIIPNGLWLVFPTYIIYVLGSEMIEGLETATGETKKSA